MDESKITETIRSLSAGFFGEVLFGFKNGRVCFAKITQTHNFDKPSRENQVETHDKLIRK